MRAYRTAIRLNFIRPGKLVENAYVESFNGKFRDECLNEHCFLTMAHARQAIEKWLIDYNTERPHSSLGNLTPEEYAKNGLARVKEAESSVPAVRNAIFAATGKRLRKLPVDPAELKHA